MTYQVTTLEKLNRIQSPLLAQVFEWVEALDRDRDHEHGPDTLEWLKDHLSRQEPNGLYQTFVFTVKEKGTTKIAGTITVCDTDRAGGEVFEATYGRQPDAFIGFAQIDFTVRGATSLFLAMCRFEDQHIQDYANRTGQSPEIVFFSDNPGVQEIGKRGGFQATGLIVETDQGDGKIKREEIFVKKFAPQLQPANIRKPSSDKGLTHK